MKITFLFLILYILNILFPLPDFKLEKDYSTIYLDRKGALLHISLSPSGKFRIRLTLDEISKYIQKGIVLYEDKYFFLHPGINPMAILRAFYLNGQHQRIVSGGSTITMQIARMMEPRPRTLLSKMIEIFRAWQLETHYSKDQLLEIYLNTIPFGRNIEGVGAASYFYYGKSAGDLSIAESSLLIGIPNSPNQNNPFQNPQKARILWNRVLKRISGPMGLSPGQVRTIMNKPVPESLFPNPFWAPHLIEAHKPCVNRFVRKFTLDLNIQTYCEDLLKEKSRLNQGQGIFNGAVIVVDNRTAEVLAYVGSPDYYDDHNGNKFNGCVLLRSPGSILKPFLYARAVEAGRITPGKKVLDIPTQYQDFNPQNFNKTFFGPVPAQEALARSLNVPAINLEYDMQGKGLKGLLMDLYPYEKDVLIESSGLSLVLGAFPLTLEEVVRLFSSLAKGGLYSPLKFYREEEKIKFSSRKILDPRTCYVISEMLSQCERPDLPLAWEFSPHLAKVAFKTGTSFGLRDAWACGYNPDFTIGVWIGNVDCKGSPFLVGIKKAAPIFISIFNYLTRDSDSWFKRPSGVSIRKICTISGEKPGPYCRETREDLYIPGVSSEQICQVHKKIMIDTKKGMEVCLSCMKPGNTSYKERIVESWPNEVISFFRKNNMKYESIPRHNPDCQTCFTKDQPQIISPSQTGYYEIDKGLPLDLQKIPLKANIALDADKVFWFRESQLVASGRPEEVYFLTPVRGDSVISVVDSKGRSDSVKIKVY